MSHSCRMLVRLVGGLLLSLLIISTAGAEMIFTDNFESNAAGAFPADWTLLTDGYGTAYQTVVADQYSSPARSFKMEGACNWAAQAYRALPVVTSRMRVSTRIRLERLEDRCLDYPDAVIAFQMSASPHVYQGPYFGDGLVGREAVPFNYDQWYTVTVEIDTDAHTWSAWLDGRLVDNSVAYDAGQTPSAVMITAHNGRHTRVWYDDVVVEDVSNLSSEAFCDNFEDGDAWTDRWFQTMPSAISLVSDPTNSGFGALEFRSSIPGSCHSSICRTDFEAGEGYYTAYVNQRHHEAGYGVYIQVQPGLNPDPIYRDSYYVIWHAADGQPDGTVMVTRRHADGTGEILAQKPSTFLKDEWIQVFIRRGPDGQIVGGYVREGVRDSVIGVDPNPIDAPGAFFPWACADVPPYTYFDDICFEPVVEPFCDDFDDPDPNAWQDRWVTSVQGTQNSVGSPVHSGSTAIEFHGSCHSSMYRADFSAISGHYTAWVNQRHHEAGFGIFIQVQPGANPDEIYRDSYYMTWHAADGEAPAEIRMMRRYEDGTGVILAQKPSAFFKDEWIQVFVRRGTGNTIVGGYERNGVRDSVIGVDPDPIGTPGQFYLWACSDVAPYTYFDDAGYDPDPNSSGDCGVLPSKLVIPSVADNPCDSCAFNLGPVDPAGIQPVVGELAREATAATVSLKIPAGVEVCDVSFDGLSTESWDFKGVTVKPDSGFMTVYLANSQGLVIPEGVTTLFNVEFLAERLCNDNSYIRWDTALSADDGRRLEFTGTNFQAFPVEFDMAADSTEIVGYIPGDVNESRDITIGDISLLIDHLFVTGISLCNLNSADVNASCGNNATISDVALLIDHLFISGAQLQCGCINQSGPSPKLNPAIALHSTCDAGVTTISVSSPVSLRGLQLVLRGSEGASPVNLVSDKLNLFYGQTEDQVRLGMIDADGGQAIAAGMTDIVRLDGDYTLVSGVVVDNHLRESVALIGSKAGDRTLPTTFSLAQNYPNPFNPVTAITFALPVEADVRLEVFNVLGQTVATLVQQHLDAGEHSMTWDASNQASGVYMYRLTAGDFVDTKKMLLLK